MTYKKIKNQTENRKFIIVLLLLINCVSIVYSNEQPLDKANPDVLIETLNVKKLSMRQFARLLSQSSGWKIVVSQDASQIDVSVYLENVYTESALKAVCQAYNLWYKKDSSNDFITIITLEEYRKGMRIHTDEKVEVVTLRYPDVRIVADTLQRLFSDRVIWNRPNEREEQEHDSIEDIEDALERMDALADRAQFTQKNNHRSESSRNNQYHRDSDYRNSRYNNREYSDNYDTRENEITEDYQREIDEEYLLEKLLQEQSTSGRINQPGVVYLSVFRETNELLLRSSDKESLKEIVKVIKQIDKPKPQILLEIKVLDIVLNKENTRGIDWLFEAGSVSGGHSTGISSTNSGNSYGHINAPSGGLIPQGTGLDPRAGILQVVSDNVLARIQLLEEHNHINRLATPILCVADNEASRIFIGTETTILKSVSIQQNTTSGDNPVTTAVIDPETNRQNIGTTLLITPRIHADRTATIRIVQEESSLGNIQTIQFGEEQSFQSQDVETSSVVTTIVAADGKISAIGGLISQKNSEQDIGVSGLMNLPLIGPLFKTHSKERIRHELLVLIRPFVLLAPGESEPISKDIIESLSENPYVHYDFPAKKIDKGNISNIDNKSVPYQALKTLSENATIWTTE